MYLYMVCVLQGKFCVCLNEHGGMDCSESASDVMWSVLPGPDDYALTRVGHSLVSCGPEADVVYMFGGYSVQQGLMNDLWQYSVPSGHWRLIHAVGELHWPTPRSADLLNNSNNNTQEDIYSAVIMTTRSLREFSRFI